MEFRGLAEGRQLMALRHMFCSDFGMQRHTYYVRPVMLGTPSAYGFHSSSSEFFNMGGMKTLVPGETGRAQMGSRGFSVSIYINIYPLYVIPKCTQCPYIPFIYPLYTLYYQLKSRMSFSNKKIQGPRKS